MPPKGVERFQERYLRWVLGVERNSLGYMVAEELYTGRLKGMARMRSWKYEKKLEENR